MEERLSPDRCLGDAELSARAVRCYRDAERAMAEWSRYVRSHERAARRSSTCRSVSDRRPPAIAAA